MHVVPLQQGWPELQLPPAATHFVAGAVVELPDVPIAVGVDVGEAVGVEPGVEFGVGVDASASEGKSAVATPAAKTLRTVRRETGVASFLASSSKRSTRMLSVVPPLFRAGRRLPFSQEVYACPELTAMGASDPKGSKK